MKLNLRLSAILSTAAVSSILLASVAPAEAYSCMFGKNKGANAATEGNSPSLTANKVDFTKKMAIAGVGITAVAGAVAAGVVYKARMAKAAVVDAVVDTTAHPEVASDVTVEEVLYAPKAEEKASASTPDKDLTLVG
ncbi:hypothetical protein [Microseira wollei]|uniref:Uncharacterized protein n=1 Tax=Microseira wollei NIES-4236 TaxID=2530354 RepID=A0AAV3X5G8_9CYAN|nr:hypothetical protein [Microseira wollei]GET35835.1 hypothetical protein MiSe_05810 [Microseira wollei NIES-4236]